MKKNSILLVVLSSFLLFSCASARQWVEKPDIDQAYGWVSFYSPYVSNGYEDELRLKITKIDPGGEGRTYQNFDIWSVYGDFRVLCTPGTHSFLVAHKEYRERITVEVYSGEVTFVSYRKRYVNETTVSSLHTETTISSYRIQPSSGTQHIPAEFDFTEVDIASLLGKSDWGVRHFTLYRLYKERPSINPGILNAVRECATYDAVYRVRVYAERVLEAYGETPPSEPVVFEGFEDNYGLWPEGDFVESGTLCFITDRGYIFQNREEDERWVMNQFPGFENNRENCRVVLDGYWVDGDESMPHGICLGESDNNFLVFAISSNGGAAVWHFSDNSWNQLLSWDQRAAETIQGGGMNRIEVRIRGNRCGFVVNKIDIGSVETDLVFGKAGMFVSGPQTILFHSLLVFGGDTF